MDHNPGGMGVHYAHGTVNELWGTCGTVWTQPLDSNTPGCGSRNRASVAYLTKDNPDNSPGVQ